MGNICGAKMTAEERDAIAASTRLERELAMSHDSENNVLKLLLLGTGESGKSTIFKQMQILYDTGFSEIERSTFRSVVRSNLVESMQTLLDGVERFGISFQDQKSIESAEFINVVDPLPADFWNPDIMTHVKQLWLNEPGVQQAYARRSEMQLLDSAAYLFDNGDRIAPPDYVPTAADILRARLRTSGIVERKFNILGVDFKFLDVGGQRNERRKWIHCFENVTSVIFVAAISEYDQVLFEDETINRLKESIEVFDEHCNNKYFQETAMILFLNKIDIFKEKLTRVALSQWFDDYDGNNTFEDASEFIQQKFVAVNKNSEKMIFCHMTCATDTDTVERVFENCKIVILRENLLRLGLS